jgi:hypothetical protein
MWPKMLFELLPHFARLMPMADRFLTSRNANDGAQETALAAMTESVRGNLGQVTEMQTGVQRALIEQSAQIAEIAVEVTRARMGAESVEARMGTLERAVETRMTGLEKKVGVLIGLLVVATILLLGTTAMLIFVLVHGTHR